MRFENGQYFVHLLIGHKIGKESFQGIGFIFSDPLKKFTLEIQKFFTYLDVQFLFSIKLAMSVFGIQGSKSIGFLSNICLKQVYAHSN